MRSITWLIASAAVAAAALLPAHPAGTASGSVPPTTVGYHRIVVTGATLAAVTNVTTEDGALITGTTIDLIGNYRRNTLTAQFTGAPAVTCSLTEKHANGTQFTCTGLRQPTDASSTLTITVS